MKKQVTLIALGWLLLTPAFAQLGNLYLIAGNTTSDDLVGYSTVLVAVAADGSVKAVQEIVPGKLGDGELGTEWMTASQEHRKAVIFSKHRDNRVTVLDFDTASVVKSCQLPSKTDLFREWLVDSPSRGLMFAGVGSDSPGATDRLHGMIIDPTVSCASSFVDPEASDMKYLVAGGAVGVGDEGGLDGMDMYYDLRENLATVWPTGERTYLDYRVPSMLFSGMKDPRVVIEINNPQILSLTLSESPANYRRLVFRKSDQTWHQFDRPSAGRGFGSFIASSEVRERSTAMRESAGKSEWRQQAAATGPSIALMLSEERTRLVYPGILHLDDIATEKSYTITTNQGDSEILLVEDGTVYYRASNRLYSAPILDTGIGPAKLLATDELIRDAHWAFIKH